MNSIRQQDTISESTMESSSNQNCQFYLQTSSSVTTKLFIISVQFKDNYFNYIMRPHDESIDVKLMNKFNFNSICCYTN